MALKFLSLQMPDGSLHPVRTSIIIGRGRPEVFSDEMLGREQYVVSPVDGVEGVLNLETRGTNPIAVEAESATSPGTWELVEVLEKGSHTLVGPSSRFYVVSRKETTMVQVVDAPVDDYNRPADEPHAKRARVSRPSTCVPAMRESPFSLTWVRGISLNVNEGCLGARLRHLVSGPIEHAFVENYMIDLGWLLSSCPDLKQGKSVVIVHGEHGPHASAIQESAKASGLTNCTSHCPPLPLPWGTHHSKAFLLAYPTGLRVIIHTANLIFTDCNNKTQGLWFQDFPPKAAPAESSAAGGPAQQGVSEFEASLQQYLAALALPAESARLWRGLVSGHDFGAARAHLVASVPGYHQGARLHSWGHMRLRQLLAKEQLPGRFRGSPLVVQCSSLGSLDERWLRGELAASLDATTHWEGGRPAAAAGGCVTGEAAGARKVFGANHTKPGSGGGGGAGPLPPLHIVWPTEDEVRNSVEGWAAGLSIPGPVKNVSKDFLQQHWCRFGGEPVGRQRAMPHIKSYTRFQGNEVAWVCVASHNLSKAAWGSLQKNGGQLMVRSYELGVLLLPRLEAAARCHPHYTFSCTNPAPESPPPTTADAPTLPAIRFVALDVRHGAHGTASSEPPAAAPQHPAPAARPATGPECQELSVYVPLPYVLPPVKYVAGDVPWMWDAPHSGPDILGHLHGAPARLYEHIEPLD